ncbi:MAG: 4-hydroxy-3-methylbut-2-enyl diphosphate reductase [Vicinamibacteria bacterium]
MAVQTYFQKGLGLKAEVAPLLDQDYGSNVIARIKELGYGAEASGLTVRLAREFGFCYGVDRAIEYAYEAKKRFPDRRLFLSGEIIHNPSVNQNLRQMGFTILEDGRVPATRYASVTAEDVVVLPAFGVTVDELKHLRGIGAILVDTTCGSVLNVWKNVSKYARDGFTVVIHGKHYHEETRATASQALLHPNGAYLCVRDEAETEFVSRFVRGEIFREEFMAKFAQAVSLGFDPVIHLERVGLANQTTMLMSESLRVQEMLRATYVAKYGAEEAATRFRSFDTICSATQDRQDAVLKMFEETPPEVMLVIGGYNSSNTQALVRICSARCPTYYVESPECIDPVTGALLHRGVGATTSHTVTGWLRPASEGPVTLGVTAGASTPDSVVARSIERILQSRGATVADLRAIPDAQQTALVSV